MAPDGRTLWVASEINDNDQVPGRVTPIRTATGKAGRPVRVGLDPGPIVVSPDRQDRLLRGPRATTPRRATAM